MLAIPIVILSFNRADYLATTLRSLMSQQGIKLNQAQIYLFQDGATNPFSKITYCGDDAIAENLALFREIVPHGVTMASDCNLGIALNFDRAERFVFEKLQADAAIFIEDDLFLGPFYLATLERLIGLALANDRVGYVAAYGDHRASAKEQLRAPNGLTIMGHNWAFGLTRRQWLRQKPYVDQYLEILAAVDYRRRDHDRIIDLFGTWGMGVPGTSQDIAKSHAAILTGAAKLNTVACFGRYIGERGVHFRPDQFAEMGFGDTFVVDQDLFEVVEPAPEMLTEFVNIARRSAMVDAVRRRDASPAPVAPPGGGTDLTAEALIEQLREYSGHGRFREAGELCATGLSRFPIYRDKFGHPAFLKESVRLALDRNDTDLAEQCSVELRARLAPADPCLHILKGRYCLRIGDMMGVRHEAQAVVRLDPLNAEAATWLTRIDRVEQPSLVGVA